MNWINNVVRPKIRNFLTTKREVPDNLWVKCPETGQMVFAQGPGGEPVRIQLWWLLPLYFDRKEAQ